ncbi:unnamed protein product [Symbiodinium pilosum]|uniref:HMG box domain-containing protein n=1 Tax=Symbiodinium pilosum TaxID=2952 RepID=A0A812Y6I2_SYMPI|nr:unnamed protein product [Symbiodinium pilosum]
MVVSSPLTRAMQTALLAVPDLGGNRVHASPLCSEHLEASCDLGRPTSQLRFAFPQVDFGDLPEVWWYVPEDCKVGITPVASQRLFTNDGRREPRSAFERRVDSFVGWLMEQTAEEIAIFAHADFCNCLLQRYFGWREARFADYWMRNCELVDVELRKEDLTNPVLTRAQADTAQATSSPAVEPSPPAAAAPNRASLALEALRQELSQQHPDLKPGELRAKAAKAWKALGNEAKAQYMARV